MSETKKENIIDCAIEYAERFQCSVIPLNPESKKPLLSEWKPFQGRIATREEIKTWWTRWPKAMIGIVTGKCSDLFVIDVDPGGENSFKELFPKEPETPTAITPRNGRHYYFAYPNAKISIKAGMLPNLDYRGEGGYVVAPPSVNSKNACYAWVTNLAMHDIPTIDLPTNILDYIINTNSTNIFNTKENTPLHQEMLILGRRDSDLFHIANTLIKAKTPINEVTQILEKLALSCNPPFPVEEVQTKINSAIARAKRADFSVTEMIKEWVSATNGNFSITECKKHLQEVTGVTTRNLGNIRVPFSRLVEDGIIERVGNRDGWFRKVEKNVDIIDISGADEPSIDLQWPFRLESYYQCHQGNIVIIAGDFDSGKTAFCLNFSALNMKKHKITYVSSEMGSAELKSRLRYFEVPRSDWTSYVKFVSRSSNFADVISPDDVTVIDFLEVSDEFWKIGGMIREIHDKVNNGMCLIAIQKKEGSKIGRGGEFALEKPRLYLSMGRNQEGENEIKIVKCKNWINPDRNPNGLMLKFKLVRGCKFIETSTWKKEDDFDYADYEYPRN